MQSGQVALRKGRYSKTGRIYLITFTTAGRRRHFASWDVAADTSRLMAAPSSWRGSRLLAWVLMPDHWHGLVELGDDQALPACIGRCKGLIARDLRKRHRRLGRIWATGYHDRALRKDEDVVAAARYVVMNPVRAGLARRVGEYPFWDAVWV